MSRDRSEFELVCPCGATLYPHERLSKCPHCGRTLDVSDWGRLEKAVES